MTNKLVIVESPTKAKTIEKFLGKTFTVRASMGHLRDLPKSQFGVDVEHHFTPKYINIRGKGPLIKELKTLAKKADKIYLATDPDREGEAIAWHLSYILGVDPAAACRISFHEITQTAIKGALKEPQAIDMDKVDAQQTRRILDRIVGYQLSPLLWRKIRKGLSAGRVQSVAVKIICDRQKLIDDFEPEEYWTSSVVLAPGKTPKITADVVKRDGKKLEIHNRAEADQVTEDLKKASYQVTDCSIRDRLRKPAPPFTTSSLQQEANKKMNFSTKKVMMLAQQLYEGVTLGRKGSVGLITYMRTDSMNLSDLCLNACGPVITEEMGADYHQRRHYHTHAKGAQEAHEAIRPTDMRREQIEGTPQEQRLYTLIRKRTLASQMADAQLEKTTVCVNVSGREEQFVTTGEVVLFDGFLRIYRESVDTEAENEGEGGLLPHIEEGEQLSRLEITARERYTRQPPRYTEASLVHKMEELGIGRPSTYAPTISTIQQREYVVKGDREGSPRQIHVLTLAQDNIVPSTLEERAGADKGKLLPTDIGTVVNDFLTANFPDIMDYNFTANVEKDFDDVAEGNKEWTSLIRQFYADFDPLVTRAMEERNELRVGERELGIDPKSGKVVKVRIGRYGPMVQIGTAEEEEKPLFATLPKDKSMASITLDEALELFKLPRTLGEYEGKPVVANTGRFGPYINHDKKFVSIPKGEDPLEISLERAIELILSKREAEEKSHLKTFDEEPELEIRAGRFGPYIAYKGKNYKIPKAQADRAAELTLEECRKIIETPAPSKTKTVRKKKA